MWKCPFCENQNYDNSKFCVCCGNKKPAENLKFGASYVAAAHECPAAEPLVAPHRVHVSGSVQVAAVHL